MYKPVYPGLYYFDTFTFTTLGTSGRRGPDSTKTYASAPWSADQFSIVNGQQQWTVPATGTYNIVAAGAYGATPGRVVSGDVDLNEGQVLSLLVGQQPTPLTANVADNVTVGGGGGTFVTVDQKPLVVASGGDGEAYSDNPWSQPVILSLSGGSYAGLNLFLDDTGTYFTRLEIDSSFQPICTSLYEYDGVNWNSTFLFPGEMCMYVNKTLGVAYSFNWLDAYTVRANDWSYINGAWTKITYADLTIPFLGNPGNFFGIQVSGNGETLRIVSQSNSNWAMYKRIINQWVFVTSLSVEVYNGMSYDGNRVINFGYGSIIYIYDYPWTSPPIEYIIPDPAFNNNNCRISPDGTLLVTFSNVYSLSDGSFVTSLPGYVYGSQSNLNISKDNKTIIKGFIGSELQVLNYPFTKVNAVLSPVSAYSFYGPPLLNENGSVLIGSDILEGTDVYYKSFTSQSGIFLPSGAGGGDSGAGFYGNGSQTNPYFQFLFPTSYVNGGFGNSYQYGTQEEGGFGGGQGPLNKFNELTQFTISESPGTFSLGGSPTVVSVNSDATVMYYGTTRYLYSGGSWNYDQDFGYSYGNGFLSVSDDGMTAVSYPTQDYFFYDNKPLGIVTGTQLYIVNGVVARVNKQGTRVVYATYPGPNVYIRDAPFTGTDYQLTLPPSLPSTSNVTSLDFSSDGTVLAIGVSTGPGGYISTTLVLVTRYPWTTYETVGPPGNIVALSPDGQTLFTAVDSSDASFIYKYDYTSQSQWQLVSQTKTGYKNTVYLATGSDGSLFVKPSDISLSRGYPSIVFNFTAYNDDFSQVGSVINSYVSNMSSDGQHLVNYDGTSLQFYTKQTITAETLVDHGFPHSYQVKYEITANYNGIHDITVTSANTFTFQGFCFANESGNLGAVSGVETGISGGGGYTGSPGDGVSGATCYADPTVKNFTDLGAASNSAGYVTVTLLDPAPIKQGVVLNQWVLQPSTFAPVTTWSSVAYGNGKYVAVSNNGTYPVMYSTNGLDWLTNTTGAITAQWTSVTFGNGKFVAVANSDGSIMYSLDGINWSATAGLLTSLSGGYDQLFGSSVALSSDGTFMAVGEPNFLQKGSVNVYKGGNVLYTLIGENTNDVFGKSVALSSDGSILAAGALGADTQTGYVNVYTNGNLTHTFVGENPLDFFGSSIALSSDGSILVVGARGGNYVKMYTNGELTHTFNGLYYGNFGKSVDVNSNGTVIAIGSYDRVEVFTNTVLTYTVYISSAIFGRSVSLNSDGTILAVGSLGINGVKVYTNGILTYELNGDFNYIYNSFGTPVDLSSDGSILALGLPSGGMGGISGSVEIYTHGILTYTKQTAQFSQDTFGTSVALSSDGVVFAGGSPYKYGPSFGYVKKYNTLNYIAPWSSVTYGNGIFMAVSSSNTMYSSDSLTWYIGNSPVDNWTSVTYGSDKFVAVSSNGNAMYSNDGITWSNVTNGTINNPWTSVSYGNGQIIAVSSIATSMYSVNGIDWTEGGPLGVSSNCITYGQGYFVCPSSDSEVSSVSISTNGQTWQEIPLTYTACAYTGISYGDVGFIAVSSTSLLLGYIPTFWVNPTKVSESTTLNSVNWSGLAHGNGKFVAVGKGLIQTSSDYGNTWSSFQVSNTLSSVTYSHETGTFLALPGFFDDGIYTSNNGLTWTLNQTLPTSVPSAQTSLTYGNGKFVAVLNGDSNVFYSRDGINWNVTTDGTYASNWSSVTFENNRFVVVSSSVSSFDSMYSMDGISWISFNSTHAVNVLDSASVALSSDGSILAVGKIYGNVNPGYVNVYTNKVLTYTVQGISQDAFGSSVSLSSDGSILAVGAPNDNYVKVYTNGLLSYTLNGEPGYSFGRSVALSSDGSILAIGVPGANYGAGCVNVYSNEVLTYTLQGISQYAFGAVIALSSDGSILAVGNATTGNVKVYTNGVLTYTVLQNAYRPIIALSSDGSILAVGSLNYDNYDNYVKVYKNGLLSYTLNGDIRDKLGRSVALSSDGSILAAGAPNSNSDTGYVKVYTNGVLTNTFTGENPYTLFGNSIALNSDGSILVASSSLELNIYNLNLLSFVGLSSITHGNGLFVAVANPGSSVYSSDGVNWLAGTAPVDAWSSIVYGNGYFVAVSDNGVYPAMYSQDGINWSTTDPGFQINNWGSVAFGGDTFFAIPTSGATTMTTRVTKTF